MIDRTHGPEHPTVGRRLASLSLGLLAAVVFVAGFIELFYALAFDDGYEEVPTTTGERLPWLLLPILIMCAAGWSIREAYRYPTGRWSPQRYCLGVVIAVLGATAWWALLVRLRA